MSTRLFFLILALAPSVAFADCIENETLGVKGIDYRGCQNQTISGKTCQVWTSQTPHEHSQRVGQAVLTGIGDDNYCRNPDNEASIWCYTTDPNSRWEFCRAFGADMTTECEATNCSASFADMNSTGKRELCYSAMSTKVWPSLTSCCPAIGEAAMCAKEKCSLKGDTSDSGKPKSPSLMIADSGIDKMGFHLVLSALLCACLKDCEAGATAFGNVLATINSMADAVKLLMNMSKEGANHTLMPSLCADSGWRCLTKSTSCTELLALPDFATVTPALNSQAQNNCGWTDAPTEAPGGSTGAHASTTGAQTSTTGATTQATTIGTSITGGGQLVSFAHSCLGAGGMVLVLLSSWLC